MCYFNKYADIFGRSRVGIHAARIPIIDWAISDTVFTVGLAYYTFRKASHGHGFWTHLIFWILLGGALHTLFGVQTPLSIG